MRSIFVCLFLSISFFGCGETGGVDSSGGGSAAVSRQTTTVTPTVYSYELSGAGVTFSADLHGYASRNYGGNQTNPTYSSILITGAQVVTYTTTSESMIASFTLNTGAGVLTIITKKNGVQMRSDTINTNATSISVNDAN